MLVVGEEADTMLAALGPLTCDQEPVPTLGVFAAISAVPTDVQMDCGGPALAVVGGVLTAMETLLVLAAQGELVMVQRNTYVPAVVIPLMSVVGKALFTMLAVTGPLTWDQAPVPIPGVLATMVALPPVVQMVWLEPALAVVGNGLEVMVTSLVLAVQGLLLMVQRNT